jgi:hypothetical protein
MYVLGSALQVSVSLAFASTYLSKGHSTRDAHDEKDGITEKG